MMSVIEKRGYFMGIKCKTWKDIKDEYQHNVYSEYLSYKLGNKQLYECLEHIDREKAYMKGYITSLYDYSVIVPEDYEARMNEITNMAYVYESSAMSYNKKSHNRF